MHPIERLRYVARAGDADPAVLACEAAEALASLSFEVRALVPACRRLLESHPTCGPLWWVAARLLVAADVREAAELAIVALEDDQSAEELAATFPSAASVLIPSRMTLADAVSLRPDLAVTVIGNPYRLRSVLGRIGDSVDAIGAAPHELDELLSETALVVTEALAASTSGFLFDPDQARIVKQAVAAGIDVWVLAGVGRILPQALFEAVRTRVVDAEDDGAEDDDPDDLDAYFEPVGRTAPRRHGAVASFVDAALIAAVVGPDGAQRPEAALRKTTCPAPAELLVPLPAR